MTGRLRRPRVIAAAIAVASLLLLVIAITRAHSSPPPPSRPVGATEGIAKRTPLAVSGLGTATPASLSCFTAYVMQPAGRDAAGQHYALTLTLAVEPASAADLVRLLATGGCSAEQQSILAGVEQRLDPTPTPGQITIDYRAPSGARIVLPGS